MKSHGRMFSLLIAGSLALCAPLVAYADEVASEGGCSLGSVRGNYSQSCSYHNR